MDFSIEDVPPLNCNFIIPQGKKETTKLLRHQCVIFSTFRGNGYNRFKESDIWMGEQKKSTTIWLEKVLLEKVKIIAKKDFRSVSNYIRQQIRIAIREYEKIHGEIKLKP